MPSILNIGLAGLGRLGMAHARSLAFHTQGARLAAICRRDPEKLKAAAAELNVTDCYTDFDEMLARADLDAVVIATASDQHAAQLTRALAAGKHVFCEKPLGVNAAECLAAERAVKAHPELVFFPGFMRRYDESYCYAMARIRAGAIGEPYLMKGYAADPMAVVDACIRYAGAGSGGLFFDLGVHDMDLMRYFLQEDPVSVYAMGGSYKYPVFGQRGDAEAGIAAYAFASGKMAVIHAARAAAHGYHVETEIVGTEGSIRIAPVPAKNAAMLYDRRGVAVECWEDFPERFFHAYRAELQEFVDCVHQGRRPGVGVEDGRKAVQIAEATKRSFLEKRLVEIVYDGCW